MNSIKLKQLGISIFLVLCFFVSVAHATDYSSTNFIVRDPVISFIAGESTSTNFDLFSSADGSAIGQSTSDSFTVRSGFLYYPAPPPPPPSPTPPPPPPPSGGGGGGGGGGPSGKTLVVTTTPTPPGEVPSVPAETILIFHGHASTESIIHILQNGIPLLTTTRTNPDGTFTLTIPN